MKLNRESFETIQTKVKTLLNLMSNMQQEAFACFDTYGENVRHKEQQHLIKEQNVAVVIML